MSRMQDVTSLLRAVQLIAEAGQDLRNKQLGLILRNSSVLPIVADCFKNSKNAAPKMSSDAITEMAKEGADRVSAVAQGIKIYAEHSIRTGSVSDAVGTLNFAEIEDRFAPSSRRIESPNVEQPFMYDLDIKLAESDKELLRKLDMEHRAKLLKQGEFEKKVEKDEKLDEKVVKAVPNPKTKKKLSEESKQRKVPSSRIGRMVSFGTLVAGLGLGTAAEYAKRTLGYGETTDNNYFLNKSNLDRIVDTLCKVRGAALKLGQILSIQDESMVHPELAKALERVRSSADFMPDWQVEGVMVAELGPDWRKKFAQFEDRPFAAASIGQVHCGRTQDGQEVAVKIQYPGVAKGIQSDIDNLGAIMKLWNIFPKGIFLENLMAVAKRELSWEVDYIREAECTKKFKELLSNYKDYYVPNVIDELSSKQVFTTEMLDGVPVEQCFDMDYEHRHFIGAKIMDLCLLEIFEFQYMQTDPNWANFLYNPSKKQLLLLDFGASRGYSKEFMDNYAVILKGACDGDRDTVLNVSRQLGFLTGYESKLMEEAHVDAVMTLGEIFRKEGEYDFAHQDVTHRIENLARTMLEHRLCPPPEEVYSLHRKLSGVFLLLAKLRISLACRDRFLQLYSDYARRKQMSLNKSL